MGGAGFGKKVRWTLLGVLALGTGDPDWLVCPPSIATGRFMWEGGY